MKQHDQLQYDDARAGIQMEGQAASSGVETASRMAAQREAAESTYKNPRFLGLLRDAGIGPDHEAELGPLLAGAHVTASRSEEYEQFIKWLNENAAEREIIRNTPGRHVQKRPTMQMVAQDVHRRDDLDWKPPMNQRERSEHRHAMDAVTNFQSLAKEGKGIETVGTVQTSTEVTRQSDEERSSWKDRATSFYK